MGNIKRDEALLLLKEYVKSDSLLRHSSQVETTMEYFARHFGEDEDKWGVVGLLHDLDYEFYPEEHCIKVVDILRKHDYPEEYIRAISSHGYGIMPNVEYEPQELMEKVLYMVDELTGLVYASILVRPSKSVLDLKAKSVKKKWKDKGFAKGVDRSTIEKGLEMLDMNKDEAIKLVIEAFKEDVDKLDLRGNI